MQKWPQTFFEVTYPFVKSISEVCIPPNIYLHSKPSDMHELIRNVKALLTSFPGQFYMSHGVFVRLQQLSLKTTLKLLEIV